MVNDKGHSIDDLFANQLADNEAPVRETVWEGIAAEMENDRLRKKVIWARFTAAASILLLVGFGVWFWWGNGRMQTTAPQFAQGNIITLPQVNAGGSSATQGLSKPGILFSGGRGSALAQMPLRNRTQQSDVQKQLRTMFVDQMGSNVPAEWTPPARGSKPTIRKAVLFNGMVPRDARVFGGEALEEMPRRTTTEDAVGYEADVIEEVYSAADFQFDNTEKKEETTRSKRWALGGNFSPDYTLASQVPIQNSTDISARTGSRAFLDPAAAEQTPTEMVTAYTTGLNLGYNVSERIGVQSGIFYQNRSSTTAGALDATGKIETLNSEFNLSMVEVPVLVKLDVIEKEKFSYYVSSGVSANLLWGYDNTLSNQEGQVAARLVSPEERKFDPAQGNLLLRTGVQYKVLDKLSLNLEPGLRYGIVSNRFAFAGDHPMQFSLNTGMNFHF